MSCTAPIFILGTTRSGTSALHLALLNALQHKGDGEGHFFESILQLLSSIDTIYASEASKLSGTFIHHVQKDFFIEDIFHLYARVYRKLLGELFIDKTPTHEAIRSAQYIHKVFPAAKVIYMQRRGIENVLSKQRKFPNTEFSLLCNEWRACIVEWRKVRQLLTSYIQIEQFELHSNTVTVIDKISSYLDLTEAESHALKRHLSDNTIEQTSNAPPANIANCGFTDEENNVFLEICGGCMREEGYSLTESYYL